MFHLPKHWMPWDNWIEALADGICVLILALVLPPLFHGNRPFPGWVFFLSRSLVVLVLYALFLIAMVGLREYPARSGLTEKISILLSHGRYFLAVIFCVLVYGLFFA